MKFGIGQAVARTEDPALITGRGRYAADWNREGQLQAVVLRSDQAHAKVLEIDIARAMAVPGVVAVLTGADVVADGLGEIVCGIKTFDAAGEELPAQARPLLVRDRVCFEGDNLALVVAETLDAAREAAGLITVRYEALPLVMDIDTAKSAPALHGALDSNLAHVQAMGDAEAVAGAFEAADHVTRLDLVNNRVHPAPMEPRSCLGWFDADEGRYHLVTSSQGAHLVKRALAKETLKVPADDIQVIIPDVGGAFGQKIYHYAEEALVLWAAKRLGRPVKWPGGRYENMAVDTHGRAHQGRAELAIDADGRFLGLRVETDGDLGAYASLYGPMVQSSVYLKMLTGVYHIPAFHAVARSYYTNTAPVDAYRGAGRPEAAYLIERLVDQAADELGLDKAEIRRRNFIPPEAMPYDTPGGRTYDCGDFERVLDRALDEADRAGFEDRKQQSADQGLLRGFGFACYIEACGGGAPESVGISVFADGRLELTIGTQDGGQGHKTAYAQIASEVLDLPLEQITVLQGDTDRIATGGGTGGSRSIPIGGPAVVGAAEALKAEAIARATELLQTDPGDLSYVEGRILREATGQTLSLAEIAEATEADFSVSHRHRPEMPTFPNGCHVCELTIDPETGETVIERFTVIDDFGALINPALVAGQVHGGVVQGIGQALMEEARYDRKTGALISSGFRSYAMPHASDVVQIALDYEHTPSPVHPLGLKGAGEAGAIGACPAVMNAIHDALAGTGAGPVDMPATPEKIWRALNSAS